MVDPSPIRRRSGRPLPRAIRIRRHRARPRVVVAATIAGLVVPAVASGLERIESEVKIRVPAEAVESVWSYLQERYLGPDGPVFLEGEGGRRFRATASEEFFLDRYFDTPELAVAAASSGVRHRTRAIPDDPEAEKHGRQLLQVKLPARDGVAENRTEIKFEIRDRTSRNAPDFGSRADRHPLLGLVRPGDRGALHEVVARIGVDADHLAEGIELLQRRRRVYLSDAEGPFATLTLDDVTAQLGPLRVPFHEIELELNENRYTRAAAGTRRAMEAVNATMRRDLLDSIPGLAVDLTPKYEKGLAALEARYPGFPWLLRARLAPMRTLALASLGALALWGVGTTLARSRRGDRARRGLARA